MRKVDRNVQELVSMIERGELQLPEMQRRYQRYCNHIHHYTTQG
jgi:hypothetical protein